jgi:hypothetical protein
LDYGILGDIVNAAARIESLTKLYGVRAIITREVLDALHKKPECRFLDRVRVKGRSQPMEFYEVLLDASTERLAIREQYLSAWKQYEAGRFQIAGREFSQLAARDGASAALAKRCEELAQRLQQEWNGIYQLAEK